MKLSNILFWLRMPADVETELIRVRIEHALLKAENEALTERFTAFRLGSEGDHEQRVPAAQARGGNAKVTEAARPRKTPVSA